jgi:hypothetical protein
LLILSVDFVAYGKSRKKRDYKQPNQYEVVGQRDPCIGSDPQGVMTACLSDETTSLDKVASSTATSMTGLQLGTTVNAQVLHMNIKWVITGARI